MGGKPHIPEIWFGAQIPSGTTSVTFRFDPTDFKIAALLSGIGIITLGIVIIKLRARKSRARKKYLIEAGKNQVRISSVKRKGVV
jgi:hypothetical protein